MPARQYFYRRAAYASRVAPPSKEPASRHLRRQQAPPIRRRRAAAARRARRRLFSLAFDAFYVLFSSAPSSTCKQRARASFLLAKPGRFKCELFRHTGNRAHIAHFIMPSQGSRRRALRPSAFLHTRIQRAFRLSRVTGFQRHQPRQNNGRRATIGAADFISQLAAHGFTQFLSLK